jgi:glycosyltransferase involved in cell wall biosynthesis
MARYADMVAGALLQSGAARSVQSLRVALPHAVLRGLGGPRGTRLHHAWLRSTAGPRLRRADADVLHVLDGSHAYVARGMADKPCVITSHDLIPALQARGVFSRRPGPGTRQIIAASLEGLRAARVIVATSACTRRDVCRLAGVAEARIVVVPNAVEPAFRPLEATGPTQGNGAAPRILHVGNDAFYKNREGVVRVFARVALRSPARLIMAGAPAGHALRKLIAEQGVADRVEVVGEADDRQLLRLYRTSALLLFPSLYEGFGWPVVEAMACGCPVVCSTGGALADVAGNAALTAVADDEGVLAEHCLRVLSDPAMAGELRECGLRRAVEFSIPRLASGLLAAYGRAI